MKSATHQDQLGRLERIKGQVAGVARMIEEKRYCIDILTQLRAVQAALRKVEEQVLRQHVEHCVAGAARSGTAKDREEKIEELLEVIGKFTG
ncbi:MAG: metal-sensitive transcriptional regulator [Bdellovibrionota bacterium]